MTTPPPKPLPPRLPPPWTLDVMRFLADGPKNYADWKAGGGKDPHLFSHPMRVLWTAGLAAPTYVDGEPKNQLTPAGRVALREMEKLP